MVALSSMFTAKYVCQCCQTFEQCKQCIFVVFRRFQTFKQRICRVSVQGVKSLAGHFACLCREFDFYEQKKNIIFEKEKGNILLHF